MRKSLKFYLLFIGTLAMLTGCATTNQNENADSPGTETVTPQVTETVEVTQAPKETEEPTVSKELHPVVADGVDYLDVQDVWLRPGVELAMLATDAENKFYSIVKAGAVKAVADLNASLEYTGKDKVKLTFAAPKKEDAIEQINIIDQFLDKAPDALCISFTDATACKTQLEMAKNNGIRLIAFDAPDDCKVTDTLVSTDNTAAATLAAKKMFETLQDGDKVVILAHNAIKQTGLERYKAITAEYTRIYAEKNLRFVDVVYVAQDGRSSKAIFDELLSAHPDLAGVICTDMVTTEMAIDYTKSMEEQTFQIVGFDISEKIIAAMKDGTILGSVAQDPYRMGYAAVVAAARSVLGKYNASTIYSDHLWIDVENLETEEAQSLFTW